MALSAPCRPGTLNCRRDSASQTPDRVFLHARRPRTPRKATQTPEAPPAEGALRTSSERNPLEDVVVLFANITRVAVGAACSGLKEQRFLGDEVDEIRSSSPGSVQRALGGRAR